MGFESDLREKIKNSPFGSDQKTTLKVILGEVQMKAASKPISEEDCFSIVKKAIKDNEQSLSFLQKNDVRCQKLLEENELLRTLLPQYLTNEQIRTRLIEASFSCQSLSEGQAIGKAMGIFKKLGLPVDGNVVKEVVASFIEKNKS